MAGLWPALQATRRDINEWLKADTGGTSPRHTGRLQWLLVTVQMAFSLVVLTQSFVLLNFSQRLQHVYLPFDPSAVLTARVELPSTAIGRSFFDQLERNLAGLSGVQAVALSSGDPASGKGWKQVAVEGQDYPRDEDHPYAGSEIISAGYFPTLDRQVAQSLDAESRHLEGIDDSTQDQPVTLRDVAQLGTRLQ